jgi:hypothetical protein
MNLKKIISKKERIYKRSPELRNNELPKKLDIKELSKLESKVDLISNKTTDDEIAKPLNQIVTIVVSGEGKTLDDAKKNALRSAIEQAFGTFISSKTEILNDKLVKDEIVSVTNGNIQNFDVLSEVQLPDGSYSSTLKAAVSVTKLTNYCESKGVEVEFKGATFAMNIKLQKLNEEAEFKAILNLCQVSKEILSKSLDYTLEVSEPISYKGSNDNFSVNFTVNCTANKNLGLFHEYFWKIISAIAMTKEEIENYEKLQKPVNNLIRYDGNPEKRNQDSLKLRNAKSFLALKNLIMKSNANLLNFRILSEIDTVYVKKCCRGFDKNTSNICYWCHGDHPDSWELSFGSGFPSAARFPDSKDHYKSYRSPWSALESSGSMYFQLFGSTSDPSVLTEIGNYFTTSYYNDFEKYYINHGGNNYWGCWLAETKPNWDCPMDLIIYASGDNLFKFKYNHILPLSELEKISKYKIEPWQNK